jgi:hypothetical protein
MMAQAVVELALMPGWSKEKKELRVAMALEQFMRDAAGPGAGNREGGSLPRSRDYQAVP